MKATAQLVNAGQTDVHWKHVWNQDSSDTFLHFYDAATAGAVTVGTTTPKVTFAVPASSGLDDGSPTIKFKSEGLRFNNGVVVAATTTVGGSSAPTNGLLLNVRYV